jgi:SP family sugar porter-like MFS transporter
MAVAVASLWIARFILTFTFPMLNAKLGPAHTFWIYSGTCVLGFFGIGLTLHETNGKTLEQIERELVD